MYDYVVIGGGIAGCCVSYFLDKYNQKVLIVDKNKIASGGSGAAGGFLSPLLGKDNKFKSLVNDALRFSVDFYSEKFQDCIINKGVLRLAKDKNDIDKFNLFEQYNPFEYKRVNGGFFFNIGSIVDTKKVCNKLAYYIDKKEGFLVNSIIKKEDYYIINNSIKTKNIIFTTGYDVGLIDEFFIQKSIRAIWGQRIDILTTTKTNFNYHKNCSVSVAQKVGDRFKISIGATHHRFVTNKKVDIQESILLLKKAFEIVKLDNIEIIDEVCGIRSASIDYFPIVGNIIDSKKTLQKYPSLKQGTKIPSELFVRYKRLYIFNGLGGRGFVLAPYIANNFVKYLLKKEKLIDDINLDRLFIREVRRGGKNR